MTEIDHYIAAKVHKLRKEANMTQADLANKLELTRATVYNMEHGRQSFTTRTLFKLTCIFNIGAGDLFPPGENPKPDERVYY